MDTVKNYFKVALKENDFLIGLGFIVFSFIMYWQVIKLPHDPLLFPMFIVCFIAIMGLCLITQVTLNMINKKGDKVAEGLKIKINSKTIATGVLLICMWVMLDILGFYTSITLFMIASYCVSEMKISAKTLLKGGIFSVATTTVLFLTFNVLMNLITPKGILF